MRKAVISANGALTLQVARSLKRIGLHWGSDIGLLGFDELEWAELAGVGITPQTADLANWLCRGEQVVERMKATAIPSASGSFPASSSCAVQLPDN
jgi:LacI family kdg operon repressor